MVKLPDPNRIPENLDNVKVIPVKEYMVASWCQMPEGKGQPTQVHLVLKTSAELPIVLRLKSKDAVDILIEALERHRNDVWPY